jgi:hypothetical protein
MIDPGGAVFGVLQLDGRRRFPRLATGDSVLSPARMPEARRNFSKAKRRGHVGVQAMIVDARPFCRGRVVGMLRDGVWRFPRLAPADSEPPNCKTTQSHCWLIRSLEPTDARPSPLTRFRRCAGYSEPGPVLVTMQQRFRTTVCGVYSRPPTIERCQSRLGTARSRPRRKREIDLRGTIGDGPSRRGSHHFERSQPIAGSFGSVTRPL